MCLCGWKFSTLMKHAEAIGPVNLYGWTPVMPNAVFTYSPSSDYDDQPEVRYHFPKTYRRVAAQAVGDWILYYEPRRTEGASSSSGRQSYFAMAKVVPRCHSVRRVSTSSPS